MIFDVLYGSAQRGELLLIEGGFCRWHLRRDGQLTIYEIIATRKGAGKEMLDQLKKVIRVTSIFAKCPSNLLSNEWYAKNGFTNIGEESTKSGGMVRWWRLSL